MSGQRCHIAKRGIDKILRPASQETLPSRAAFSVQKLLFCLYKSCATECNTDGKWAHETVAERALTVTWVVDDRFVLYIDQFLKLKKEASGYAECVRTSENQDRYVDNFYATEGIRLDKEAIRPSAAKRGLEKLCLNSMWGKLTEWNDWTMTEIITEPKGLYDFSATRGVEVTTLLFVSDDVDWLSWKGGAEEYVPK